VIAITPTTHSIGLTKATATSQRSLSSSTTTPYGSPPIRTPMKRSRSSSCTSNSSRSKTCQPTEAVGATPNPRSWRSLRPNATISDAQSCWTRCCNTRS
jgi:hypothetical protein